MFELELEHRGPRDPHHVTRQFEYALCEYTGARFAVTTTSCTQAILMALAYVIPKNAHSWTRDVLSRRNEAVPMYEVPSNGRICLDRAARVTMPRLSYVGVPAAIVNAGGWPTFRDEDWQGEYEFGDAGRGVLDSARRFTSAMYRQGAMQCVSFHWSKILGLSQGGAILHDNPEADAWLRRARFDGRTEGRDPKVDQVRFPSWHAYLSPEVAAHGLMKLSLLPKHNPDLPRSDYPDLSLLKAFQ